MAPAATTHVGAGHDRSTMSRPVSSAADNCFARFRVVERAIELATQGSWGDTAPCDRIATIAIAGDATRGASGLAW